MMRTSDKPNSANFAYAEQHSRDAVQKQKHRCCKDNESKQFANDCPHEL
jgi:hypothetical protein